MLISIIIPAHNEEAYLDKCLHSVHLSASYSNTHIEVIVVSDASSDATPSIAKKWGVEVLEVDFRSRAKSRNYGAAVARGELIVFIDADTVLSKLFFKRILPEFDNQGRKVIWPRLLALENIWGANSFFFIINVFSQVTPLISPVIVTTSEYWQSGAHFDEKLGSFEDHFYLRKAWILGIASSSKAVALTSTRRVTKLGYARSIICFLLACLNPHSYQWSSLND